MYNESEQNKFLKKKWFLYNVLEDVKKGYSQVTNKKESDKYLTSNH